MNIAEIVGPVDVYSAFVVLGLAAGATITATSLIVKHETKRKTDQLFELEKLKLSNEDAANARKSDVEREVSLGKIAANRQVEIARIEGGMVDVGKIRGEVSERSSG